MESKKIIQQIFSKLNKDVSYVYFRDSTYLYDNVLKNPKDDIDILIARKDLTKLIKIFYEHKYITFQKITSKTRKIGFFHYENKNIPSFDVQIDHIHKIRYISGEEFLKNTILKKGIKILKEEEKLLVLVLKDLFLISYFGLKKYSKSKISEIYSLYAKKKNKIYLEEKLEILFGSRGKIIIDVLDKKKLHSLSQRKNTLLHTLFLKHPSYLKHFIFNLYDNKTRNKVFKKKVFSFLGVDGSGKSTIVENISSIYDRQHIKHKQYYMGRWIRITSIKKLSTVSNSKYGVKKKKPFFIIFARDIMYALRYSYLSVVIAWQKLFHRYIITDRYAYDLLTQKDTLGFLSWYVKHLYPKPTTTFLLYNDPKIIFSRKKEQTIPKLTHHQNVLGRETKKNRGYFILSDTPHTSLKSVLAVLLYENSSQYSFLKGTATRFQKMPKMISLKK